MRGLEDSSLKQKGVKNFEVKDFVFLNIDGEGVVKASFSGCFMIISTGILATYQTGNAFRFMTRNGSCYGFEAENFREMLKLRKAAKYFVKVNSAEYYRSV